MQNLIAYENYLPFCVLTDWPVFLSPPTCSAVPVVAILSRKYPITMAERTERIVIALRILTAYTFYGFFCREKDF